MDLTEMTANHPGKCQGEFCANATCAKCTGDVVTPAFAQIQAINRRLTSGQIWNLLLTANVQGTVTRHGITVTRDSAGYHITWR